MKTSLLSLTLLAAFVLSAKAGAGVTASPKPPAQDLVLSLGVPDEGAAGYQWRNTAAHGRRDLGQIFVPESAFIMDRITVQLQSGSGVGAKGAPFRLIVFEWDQASKKMSRTLVDMDGTLPAAVSPANTFLSFDLGDGKLELEGGVTYGFLLVFEEQFDARALSLQSENENTEQPAIRRIESPDGARLLLSKSALEFYLQGTKK
jgi:hypothetical protein